MPASDQAARYDAVVIGAGMSGLAAGIRLAQFGRRVAVLERHYLWGGLNSFYKIEGRRFDVGLHALTNYVPPRTRGTPLARILRQLRLRHEDLRLGQQDHSEILFPGVQLDFSNDPERLEESVAGAFPTAIDGFRALVEAVEAYDLNVSAPDTRSARAVIAELVGDSFLTEMLLLPALFYGSPREDDLDWSGFCILFQSIFLEGLSRPEGGIKPVLDLLVARLREEGGELRLRAGVRSIPIENGRAVGVILDDGTEIEAGLVLSSAGWPETMRLVGTEVPSAEVGRISFLESISVLDTMPAELGVTGATAFYCTDERAVYRVPDGLIEPRSGVISAPNNFDAEEPMPEGIARLTVAANYDRWQELDTSAYAAAKDRCADEAIEAVTPFLPDWRPHTVFRDVFTPSTIERFTWRFNGAVYGSPVKHADGKTGIDRLAVIGTDQGMLGVVGALVSGIMMANVHGAREVPVV